MSSVMQAVRRRARARRVTLRAIGTGLVYLFALAVAFEVDPWKAAAISIAVVIMIELAIGGRRLQQIAVPLFLLAIIEWTDLLPLEEWAKMVVALLTRQLA